MTDRTDRFLAQPDDIKEEGYLGKDGKIYAELPEDQRMDFSGLYDQPQEADASTK